MNPNAVAVFCPHYPVRSGKNTIAYSDFLELLFAGVGSEGRGNLSVRSFVRSSVRPSAIWGANWGAFLGSLFGEPPRDLAGRQRGSQDAI